MALDAYYLLWVAVRASLALLGKKICKLSIQPCLLGGGECMVSAESATAGRCNRLLPKSPLRAYPEIVLLSVADIGQPPSSLVTEHLFSHLLLSCRIIPGNTQ